jgi:molecular chaperone GrpE
MEMIDKNRQTAGRIPVRFMDEDKQAESPGADDKTSAELGRESAYDDATDMQRRIDRGREEDGGRGRADDRDRAGGPRHEELPERREEQDTNPRATAAHYEALEMSEPDDFADDDAVEIDAGASLLSSQAELFAAQDEARDLAAQVEKLRVERQDLRELLARRQADFENSRKRMERERSETYQRVVADVVGQLLPVMDNLRRALDVEASVEANESEEFRHFLHGVELISKQLSAVLERLGVEPVPTVGRPFDPHVHEAIATEQTDEFAPDTVVQEVQRGYRLGDKLIRPAMVKVATK